MLRPRRGCGGTLSFAQSMTAVGWRAERMRKEEKAHRAHQAAMAKARAEFEEREKKTQEQRGREDRKRLLECPETRETHGATSSGHSAASGGSSDYVSGLRAEGLGNAGLGFVARVARGYHEAPQEDHLGRTKTSLGPLGSWMVG